MKSTTKIDVKVGQQLDRLTLTLDAELDGDGKIKLDASIGPKSGARMSRNLYTVLGLPDLQDLIKPAPTDGVTFGKTEQPTPQRRRPQKEWDAESASIFAERVALDRWARVNMKTLVVRLDKALALFEMGAVAGRILWLHEMPHNSLPNPAMRAASLCFTAIRTQVQTWLHRMGAAAHTQEIALRDIWAFQPYLEDADAQFRQEIITEDAGEVQILTPSFSCYPKHNEIRDEQKSPRRYTEKKDLDKTLLDHNCMRDKDTAIAVALFLMNHVITEAQKLVDEIAGKPKQFTESHLDILKELRLMIQSSPRDLPLKSLPTDEQLTQLAIGDENQIELLEKEGLRECVKLLSWIDASCTHEASQRALASFRPIESVPTWGAIHAEIKKRGVDVEHHEQVFRIVNEMYNL